MKRYVKNGNTTIVAAGLTINSRFFLYLFKVIASSFCRNIMYCLFGNVCPLVVPRHFAYLDRVSDRYLPSASKLNSNNDMFRIIGVKMWYDGSPYVGSMYMSSTYVDSDLVHELHIVRNNKNKRLIEIDEMKHYVEKYNNAGWKMLVHTQGDLAIQETLSAFDSVSNPEKREKLRHRFEHCMLLNNELVNKMNDVKVTPSFHINHIYYYGRALTNIIGSDLVQRIFPISSYANSSNNAQFSLHSDSPMFESDPLSLITTATSRKTRQTGEVIGGTERISIIEALRSMTIMAAWQIGMDDKIGSLEVGKYADFVVLDKNPLLLYDSPDEIRNIKIESTFIGGAKF